MMGYIALALVKILDNIISTIKSIAVYKEQKFFSSILVIVSSLIFYLVVSKVIEDNTILAIIIVSISSGVGNYIALLLNDRYKADEKWTMILACSNIEDVNRLRTYLSEHGIKNIACNGLTKKGENTIHIIAFSKTKTESRLIEKYLKETKNKYLKEVI